MVTIAGGKWTTYRLMAADAIDAAVRAGALNAGAAHPPASLTAPPESNARLESEVLSGAPLTSGSIGEIERLTREEMARTVEDVLARRTRALFMDARSAATAAQAVAEVLARTLGRDLSWVNDQVHTFSALAKRYLPD
jgi:glycerol-3-phosphate dehydrogenase